MPGKTKRAVPIERYVAMTLPEIAKVFGVTPQAIRHTEKNALRKIREQLIARGVVTKEGRYAS